MKTCTNCGETLPLNEFYRYRDAADGLNYWCRACCSENQRRIREQNRAAVFSHYGRTCACCGTAEDLSIDHMNGDGREHRAKIFGPQSYSPAVMYRWLIKQGFPDGFQTLCRPCNNSKKSGERCRLEHNREAA